MNLYNHNFAGSKWWKFDFHTHTPASADYGQKDESLKNISPEKWLLHYMKAEIDCVAVTDHNSGQWIDKLKKAYKILEASDNPDFRKLFIFPAVEISVSGNIHLLAILDADKNSSDISRLLGNCEYQGEEGETETVTKKSFDKVVEAIDAFGAIAIPAHVDKKRGLFEEAKGNTLKGILNLPQIYACQLEDKNYKFPELYKSEKIDWAFISGSDSHQPEEIGRAYTWVKMGKPCFEGLKLALMDGGDFSLIRSDKFKSDFNPNAYSDFIIKSIEIKNARYCGGKEEPLNIEFNPWLNCIIGGRGTGKSTIIEFLRIVMRKERELKALGEDSEPYKTFANFKRTGKTREEKGALSENTEVIAKCLLDNSEFLVQWANNGSLPAIMEKDSLKQSPGEVSSRFPVRIYSQKQIFETASNPQSLLNIIDKAPETEYQKWKDEHNQICAKYKSLKAKIREFEIKIKKENLLKGNLADINRKLAIFHKGKYADISKQYRQKYYQIKEIESFLASLTKNYESIENLNIEAASPNLQLFEDTNEIKKIFEDYIKKTKEFNNNLSELKTEFNKLIQNFNDSLKNTTWQNDFNKTIADFNAFNEKLKAKGIANPNEYGEFIQKKQIIETEIKEIENLKQEKETAEQEAESLLNNLKSHRIKLTEQREKFIKGVLEKNPFIKIQIEECGYKENLEKSFRNLINCETRFETIIENLLFDLQKNSNPKGRFQKLLKLKENIKKLKNGEDIKGISDKRFFNRIQNDVTEEMLDNIDLWYPEDKIKVLYKREKKYEPIEHGSAGQKNAAILAFLLEYGKEPIILDQPEDDLDNQLIFDLIVKQIKENKKRRQIIIVTHNPNIVVNGDAEMINVLDFENGQCKTIAAGCLQEKNIRQEICRIMEGGKDAFEQRFKRINIG